MHRNRNNSLTKGPDTVTKKKILHHADSLGQRDAEAQKNFENKAVKQENNPVDSPFETDILINVGRKGPIDTWSEEQQYLENILKSGKKSADKKTKDLPDEPEAPNNLTPRAGG